MCLYKEVDKKYTDCNLKTKELLDCALIGVCAVIRLNMVDLVRLRLCVHLFTYISSPDIAHINH